MKSFSSIIWTVLGLSLLAVLGYILYYSLCFVGLAGCIQTYKWNEKMTLVVETPQGVKQASSVQSVAFIVDDTPLVKGASTWIRGEAVVLEVLPGKYLFALLKGGDGNWKRKDLLLNRYTEKRFQEKLGLKEADMKFRTQKERVAITMKAKGIPFELNPNETPMFVTFTDISDPTSIKKVDSFNLTAFFGEGVKLKAITLEVTEEPIERGRIINLLKWFGSPKIFRNPGWASLTPEVQQAISGLVDSKTTLEITKNWSRK